ncbi:MAG: POTRA domain-containing protein [Rhodothermales bacterium]
MGTARFRTHALLLASLVLVFAAPIPVSGQARGDAEEALWRLFVDGRAEEWPIPADVPLDSVDSLTNALLAWYESDGYYLAKLDSVRIDSVPRPSGAVFVDAGQQTVVGNIDFSGTDAISQATLLAAMDTRSGDVLRQRVLEHDIGRLLRKYEARGFVLTSIEIVRIADDDGDGRLDVAIHVVEGPVMELGGVELLGAQRTRPSYVAHVLGLQPGTPLGRYDTDDFKRRLLETGLFADVDSIRLAVSPDQRAIMRLWLQEDVPGSFDAAIGYLPGTTQSGGGSVVGNVNILLRHVFGAGRVFDFRFNRLPGSTSRVSVHTADPFAFGLPVRIAVGFDGFQQDSTYDSRRYGLEGGLRLAEGLEVFANASRELTRPGSSQRSDVPSSDSWFAGVGFRYLRIDRRINPRQGYEIESNVESGRKRRDPRQLAPSDLAREVIRQQRFSVKGRTFFPLKLRQVGVLGIDAKGIQSPSYDIADLIKLGGAQSLRGYNEEQFSGNVVARLMAEWRYLLDRTSHLFVFLDLGYYGAPETGTSITVTDRREEFLAGYGFGLELGTEAGQFSVSLGFNREEGLDAKVHLGMSLGL